MRHEVFHGCGHYVIAANLHFDHYSERAESWCYDRELHQQQKVLSMDLIEASKRIRETAAAIANETPCEAGATNPRRVWRMLFLAWCDAVRDEWYGYAAADPVVARQLAVAKAMMAAEGYDGDPIIGLPGAKPLIARVGDRECISYEHSLVTATPLSAVFAAQAAVTMKAIEEVTAMVEKKDGNPDGAAT